MTVVDVRKLVVALKCMGCCWDMQGLKFSFNVEVLDLSEYNLILGVDWMKVFYPVTFAYKHNRLLIWKGTEEIEVKGIGEDVGAQAEVCLITCKEIHELV